MLHPEFTCWEFEIEYCWYAKPREIEFPWWASLQIFDGNGSIGWGYTPWEAIACAIREISTYFDRQEMMGWVCDKLIAGELTCPGCGTAIPAPTEENPMSRLFCAAYPHCVTREPSNS